MSILKLFVDIFVNFVIREVIIISFWIESILILDRSDNSKKEKIEKMNQWK